MRSLAVVASSARAAATPLLPAVHRRLRRAVRQQLRRAALRSRLAATSATSAATSAPSAVVTATVEAAAVAARPRPAVLLPLRLAAARPAAVPTVVLLR